MISKKAERLVGKILKQVAQSNGVTVEEVRRDIECTINECMNNPNAIIQARWAAIPRKGEMPTVEEFIAYTTFMVRQDMDSK